MNINDAMKARRTLVTLLRQPEKWPANYSWVWTRPFPEYGSGHGLVWGCARVLAEQAGILNRAGPARELGLTHVEEYEVFCHSPDDTAPDVANYLEQTIPMHEMLL